MAKTGSRIRGLAKVLRRGEEVATEIVPRKNAYSPRSAGWTLYRPQDVAEKLGRPLEEVDRVLEETGFNKAVRIRELLIKKGCYTKNVKHYKHN